jgi:hypothetical protein
MFEPFVEQHLELLFGFGSISISRKVSKIILRIWDSLSIEKQNLKKIYVSECH